MPCAADATRTAAAGADGFGPGYGDSQAGIFHFKIFKALSWGYRGYKPLGCVCVCVRTGPLQGSVLGFKAYTAES